MQILFLIMQYSFAVFLVAIGASMLAERAIRNGEYDKALIMSKVSMYASGLVFVAHVGYLLFGGISGVTLIMAALWAYWTYRSWVFVKKLGG